MMFLLKNGTNVVSREKRCANSTVPCLGLSWIEFFQLLSFLTLEIVSRNDFLVMFVRRRRQGRAKHAKGVSYVNTQAEKEKKHMIGLFTIVGGLYNPVTSCHPIEFVTI